MAETTDQNDEQRFTARDVQDLAGLTYRQLNDWEARGIGATNDDRGAKWRRYSPKQIFALMVCAEFRKRFGIPVERLGFVQQFMFQDDADHLQAAAELMALLGVGVWIVTDFEDTFIMDSELEFNDLISLGWLRGDASNAFVWLKVNPIVNRILACRKEPIHLAEHGAGYKLIEQATASGTVRSADEYELLRLIRTGNFDRIEITLSDGEVKTIRTSEALSPATTVEELLRSEDYQTLTVVTKAGKPVSIRQDTTKKRNSTKRKASKGA